MLGVQLALGIGTLLLQVPVALGAAHQAGALVLFGLSLWLAHALRRAGS
jgi:cytochrome c oxidase assembly protein subunit 15